MSEKRSGGRDISELKARLGLKKGGPAQPGRAHSATGGVVPPPGVNVPAPPGTQAARPVLPNAADDPFGNMNAMAQMGAVQRAPEFVIVNDGKPVEQVGTSKRWATIGKYAAMAIVPLVLGMVVGGIGRGNAFLNQGVSGAKVAYNAVQASKKTLGSLQQALEEASKKGGFKPSKELTASLEGPQKKLEEIVNAQAAIFGANLDALGRDQRSEVVTFFAQVSLVHQELTTHQQLANFDDLALTQAAEAVKKAVLGETENAIAGQVGYPYRYGVMYSAATGVFGAQLVELGPPYCGAGTQSTTGTCTDGFSGAFAYREAPGVSWAKGDIARPGSTAPTDKTIVPLVGNKLAEAVLKGNEGTAAEFLYAKRLTAISKKLEELIGTANALETKLKAKAGQGEKFTFFM